jgi:hypothetical protein
MTEDTKQVEFTREKIREGLETFAQSEPRLRTQMDEGVINPIMLAKFIGVIPQMMYNYVASKRIPAHYNNTGKLVIDLDDAVEFLFDRATRAAEKRAKEAAELAGSTS